MRYCLNQEQYIKVFLLNDNLLIDNSVSECSNKTFCLDKKNWMFYNIANGTKAGDHI
ncbi:MAG: transposase [Lachnospirales bacterium]